MPAESAKFSGYRKVRLLNVDVDDITLDELVENFRQGVMLTLHVDMIMKLQKDEEFFRLLPEFDIVTCDSQILIVAAKLLRTPLKGRVSGSDYFPRFYTRYKHDPSVTVFICGGAPGVAAIAQRNVNAKVGRQMIVGTNSPSRDFESRPGEIEQVITDINLSGATVLLVGLGGAARRSSFFAIASACPESNCFSRWAAPSITRPKASNGRRPGLRTLGWNGYIAWSANLASAGIAMSFTSRRFSTISPVSCWGSIATRLPRQKVALHLQPTEREFRDRRNQPHDRAPEPGHIDHRRAFVHGVNDRFGHRIRRGP